MDTTSTALLCPQLTRSNLHLSVEPQTTDHQPLSPLPGPPSRHIDPFNKYQEVELFQKITLLALTLQGESEFSVELQRAWFG